MATRGSIRERALEHIERDVQRLLHEIRSTRRASGLSIREAAESVGLDPSSFARLERNEIERPTAFQLALACAAVGLELSARSFLVGEPARDAGQLRLLERFRPRLAPALPWATEVPMPIPGDLRALDGWTRADALAIGIEAEVRLGDLQALQRRAAQEARRAARSAGAARR